MDRRHWLSTLSALGTVAWAGAGLAQTPDEHAHHHHTQPAPLQSLAAATSDCVGKGQVCLNHCLMLLGQGDKSMAGCASAVNQMLALCQALGNLANQQSKLVPALAKVALEACQTCEQECRKHENEHAECKACAESCALCIVECKVAASLV